MIEKSMNLASRMTFTHKELKLMRIGHNLKACAGGTGRTQRGRGCQWSWSSEEVHAACSDMVHSFLKKKSNVHYKKIHVICHEELKLCNVHLVKAIKFLVWNSCLIRIFVSNSSLRIMIRIFVSNSSLRIIFFFI